MTIIYLVFLVNSNYFDLSEELNIIFFSNRNNIILNLFVQLYEQPKFFNFYWKIIK